MKLPFQFNPASLRFSAADLADLPSADSIIQRMESHVAARFGVETDGVSFVGTHMDGDALMGEFVVHCDRCGKVQKEPVCEHCLEAIKPKTTVEKWRGFEVHSTVRREGKSIWIDEVVYEAN